MTWLIGLALKAGIPTKFAKPFVFAALAIGLLGLLWGAKCAYDRSIIKTHDAQREAQIAKVDRKADAKSAVERRADDARLTTETQEVKEAVNEARASGADPRAAYYKCIQLQQAARRSNQPPPDC
jgi:hypothetical protein